MQLSSLINTALVTSAFQSVFGTLGIVRNEIQILQTMELPQHHVVGTYDKRRPVVIWHGLGDNYNSSGMNKFQDILNQLYPELFVHVVYLDKDSQLDERRSFVGDLNEEIDFVCQQISSIPELADGFDGVGFSQGGLFLRGLLERCPAANINNLITFGSPHMGVMDLPLCSNPNDWICKRRNAFLKHHIWEKTVQKTVIPAQYFRDPYEFDKYLFHSNFLVDINNEAVDHVNSSYIHKMHSLNNLVMIKFNDDTTVVPKESCHFQEVDITTGEVIPMTETDIYKYDLLGLKKLEKKNKLQFYDLDGPHMSIPDTFLVDIANKYLAGEI